LYGGAFGCIVQRLMPGLLGSGRGFRGTLSCLIGQHELSLQRFCGFFDVTTINFNKPMTKLKCVSETAVFKFI
jgi:hypothetical protein